MILFNDSKYISHSSGSSSRVRGVEKHEIYVAAFGGHLFMASGTCHNPLTLDKLQSKRPVITSVSYSAIHKAAVRPATIQNVVWRAFQPPAPFTAYGDFRNCTRQNHGMAGNREAGGFVNSAVMHSNWITLSYYSHPKQKSLLHRYLMHFYDFCTL